MKVAIVGLDRLADCHAIRRVVFIEEQQVPEADDLDGRDPACTHFLATLDGLDVGTARLRVTEQGTAKAERVAVLAGARGRGVGAALMAALEAEAARRGHGEVLLAAQETALPFYLRLGYALEGEPFVDAGIPHRWMRRPVGGG